MVDLIAAWQPARKIHTVGDAAYGSGAFDGLPAHVTITSRLRSDAALYRPQPARTGKRGQPAKKGARLPTLAQIATDPTTAWQQITATRYGKTEQISVTTLRCLWPGAFTPERPASSGTWSRCARASRAANRRSPPPTPRTT